MIFTKQEIQNILELVDAHTRQLLGLNLGYGILRNSDKKLLTDYGFDIKELQVDWPPYLQSFLFGRLAGILKETQLRQITYSDFINYLKKQQFIPLSPREKQEYEVAKEKTYSHIVRFGNKMKSEVASMIYGEDQASRLDQEKVLRQELKRAVLERKQLKTIISDIGKRMGTWSIDWARIVDTEMQDIFNRGVAQSIRAQFGNDQLVYKDTFAGACRFCIKLHLTSGSGSEPIVFKLSDLYANGSNIGKKKEDWLATVGPEHPFCRCHIRYVLPSQVWDQNRKEFVTKTLSEKIDRKSKVIITVDEKKFIV